GEPRPSVATIAAVSKRLLPAKRALRKCQLANRVSMAVDSAPVPPSRYTVPPEGSTRMISTSTASASSLLPVRSSGAPSVTASGAVMATPASDRYPVTAVPSPFVMPTLPATGVVTATTISLLADGSTPAASLYAVSPAVVTTVLLVLDVELVGAVEAVVVVVG